MDPRFTLRQLRYFIAAAKAGSVNQAAYNISISAPSISSAINQLEEHYQLRLFVRHHSQGLLMTEDGKRLFQAAEELFAQAQMLESTAQDLGNTMPSEIHLGCFISLAPVIIPPIFKVFEQRFPDTRLVFHEGSQAALFDSLRNGTISMAFTYRFNISRNVVFDPLGEVAPYCILPPDHRLAGRAEVTFKELENDPMILLDLPKSYNYYMALFSQYRITPKIAHKTSSPEVVRVLVSHGLGYSILTMPTQHPIAMDGSRFAIVPLADSPPSLRVGMVSMSETMATFTYKTMHGITEEALDGILLPIC